MFIWWSINHSAVCAIWAGNSSISIPIKLIDVAQDVELRHVERQLSDDLLVSARKISSSSKRKFAVSDDEEVAAPASRIKEFQLGEPFMEVRQALWSGL